MEDSYRLIKETCKILECGFANDEEIEFDNAKIFEFLVRCIWRIDASTKDRLTTHVFPNNIAGRLMQATLISEILENWKIRGDIGFHNILYGSINTMCHVCVDLIRKIPTEFEEAEIQEGPNHLLEIAQNSLNSENDALPFICRSNKFSPEIFQPNGNCENSDPRTWIYNLCSDSSAGLPSKPNLPVKPQSLMKSEIAYENTSETMEVDEEEDPEEVELKQKLEEFYSLERDVEKRQREYDENQRKILKMQEETEKLRHFIAEHNPLLLELLDNIEGNAPRMMLEIEEINERMEIEAQEGLKRKAQLTEELEEITKQCIEKGVNIGREKTLNEIVEETLNLREEIENEKILIEKLKKKLNLVVGDNFHLFEKRNTEVEKIIEKQEAYVRKINSELQEVRKRQERENEMIDRSFSTIINTLAANIDEHHTERHMETFLKIHLLSSDIVDCTKTSAQLKMETEKLYEEVAEEERKDYDKQQELIEKDITEIEIENARLVQDIMAMDPTFDLKAFLA